MDVNNNSIFTAEEQARLDKYAKIRDNMINSMAATDLDNNRDRRMMNELLMAGEKNIQDSAANRLKHQDNMNKDAIAETMAAMLKEIHGKRNVLEVKVDRLVDVTDDVIPLDTVPGEMDTNPEQLVLSDFEMRREE